MVKESDECWQSQIKPFNVIKEKERILFYIKCITSID